MLVKQEKKVISNYYQYSSTVINYTNELNPYVRSWSTEVYNKDGNTHILKTYPNIQESFMKENIQYYLISPIFIKILNIIKSYVESLNNLKVTVIIQYTFDSSKRYLLSKNNNMYENKSIIIISMKYIMDNNVISVQSYTSTIIKFNLNKFIKFLKSEYSTIIELIQYKETKTQYNINHLYFSPFSSSILVHEIFGHLFEIDNFENLRLNKSEIKIPKFISVIDCPKICLSGYCMFDDYGNKLSNLTVIKNGIILNLIGEHLKNTNSTRIRAGESLCIPRCTNTIIRVDKHGILYKNIPKNNILIIQGIKKVKLINNKIFIYIDTAYIIKQYQKYRISLNVIIINVLELINNIIGFDNNYFKASFIDCIKQNQRCGGVGSSSPGIFINIEKCNIQFNEP